jgi:hypothetical protein
MILGPLAGAIPRHKEEHMTELQRQARLTLPLSVADVELAYNAAESMASTWIARLCESHERLRMQADGAESLWEAERTRAEGLEAEIEKLKAEVARLGCAKDA